MTMSPNGYAKATTPPEVLRWLSRQRWLSTKVQLNKSKAAPMARPSRGARALWVPPGLHAGMGQERSGRQGDRCEVAGVGP